MEDQMVTITEYIKANFSSVNPTLTQMSGRIFTAPPEHGFMAPSLVIGPAPEGPSNWLSVPQLHYKQPVPITAYDVYDVNPLNTSTTARDAKIRTWNMIDSVRSMIKANKNLSFQSNVQVAYNYGTPRKVNLTKFRPPIFAVVQNIMIEYVDDLGVYP